MYDDSVEFWRGESMFLIVMTSMALVVCIISFVSRACFRKEF